MSVPGFRRDKGKLDINTKARKLCTYTFKAYMHIKPENIKAERKRLRRMVNKALRGEATRESIDMSYQTWRSYAEKGDNYKALKRMDTYYSSLWEENNNGTNRETENEFEGKGNA